MITNAVHCDKGVGEIEILVRESIRAGCSNTCSRLDQSPNDHDIHDNIASYWYNSTANTNERSSHKYVKVTRTRSRQKESSVSNHRRYEQVSLHVNHTSSQDGQQHGNYNDTDVSVFGKKPNRSTKHNLHCSIQRD